MRSQRNHDGRISTTSCVGVSQVAKSGKAKFSEGMSERQVNYIETRKEVAKVPYVEYEMCESLHACMRYYTDAETG
jgi:heterodisulfide reductase subunit A-like polyferredoxin